MREIGSVEFRDILSGIWLLLSFCAILTVCVPALHSISTHGKRQIKTALARSSSFTTRMNVYLQVPKRYFWHMYLLGLISVICMIATSPNEFYHISPEHFLILTLWTVHLTRRLLECHFITIYSDSTMHIAGYVAGLLHYVLASCTIVSGTPYTSFTTVTCALLIYIFASCVQHYAHITLYHIKCDGSYRLPKTLPFRHTATPHYFAEILLYVSFLLLVPNYASMCLLVWVTVNLAVVADQQHKWYLSKFPEEVPQRWSRLIPAVW